MKMIALTICIIVLYSCNTMHKAASYYYVEPFKEQEIKLSLNDDSTFCFQDLTGCNQFEFVGRYKLIHDNAFEYLLFDSVKLKNVLSNSYSDLIFHLKDSDTAWVINDERIAINKQSFKFTTNRHKNLQKIRYKELERYYTNLLGKKGFLKAFSDGKSKKTAKKRLLECKIPDINFR